jgi:nucleotide-binding universal stress UspA family protein
LPLQPLSIVEDFSEKDAERIIKVPGNPWEAVLEREKSQMIEDFTLCLVGDFYSQVVKETLVAVGPVAGKIVDVAKERKVSMIVMSTHGRSGLARSLAGSIAEKVTRHAPCPVFSVRPKGL